MDVVEIQQKGSQKNNGRNEVRETCHTKRESKVVVAW
jgi:hypothetical protein